MTTAPRNSEHFSLITHNDAWREYFGGIECDDCEEKTPFGSQVYNEDGTNNFLCVKCFDNSSLVG